MNKNTTYFATIGSIHEDGVSLIFDGQSGETKKHYKVNKSVIFSPGDRVKLFPDSGTYIVEYAVGYPKLGDAADATQIDLNIN